MSNTERWRNTSQEVSVLIKKHTKMTTSEKAVEVLKAKYGIDARIYEDNVYLAVWNDDLSDTIDVEASKGQVKDWAEEYDKDTTYFKIR